jgi:hypothetical protein
MKPAFWLMTLIPALTLLPTPRSQADEPAKGSKADLLALQAADDLRTASMKAADRAKLESVLSADLHYAHSNGALDTKASLLDLIASGKSRYQGFEYEKRDFSFPAPNLALMTGRIRIRVLAGETATDNYLSYLAVWRNENGQWRFLAWQSCKIPMP